jgi:multimeric flavodoxin WrbA
MPDQIAAPEVLMAFYSRIGVTEALADSIAAGALEAGANVRLRRAREIVGNEVMDLSPGWREAAEAMNGRHASPTEADAEWADAIVFGSPSRFGTPAVELKAYIDSLGACGSKVDVTSRQLSAEPCHSIRLPAVEAAICSDDRSQLDAFARRTGVSC